MFILIGEMEGDYDDYYERPVESIACSHAKEKLVAYWECFTDRDKYVDYRIEEAPEVE
jgi:hypothetical protein